MEETALFVLIYNNNPSKKKEQKFYCPFFRRIPALFLVTRKWKMCKNAAEIVQKNGQLNFSTISALFFYLGTFFWVKIYLKLLNLKSIEELKFSNHLVGFKESLSEFKYMFELKL